MFSRINSSVIRTGPRRGSWLLPRFLSHAESKAALKPFYFAVHPDLFGQFPAERATNEDSLKRLNSYIDNIENKYPVNPTHLTFYLKDCVKQLEQQQIRRNQDPKFKTVRISLFSRDLSFTVQQILKSCGMHEDVVNVQNKSSDRHDVSTPGFGGPADWLQTYRMYGDKRNIHESQFQKKPKITLTSFIYEQIKDAKEKLDSSEKAYEETMRISQQISAELELRDLSLDCGWTCASCQGALKNLLYLCKEKMSDLYTLRGRSVVLTRWTGVDPHGNIMLNVEDVPQYWLALFGTLEDYDVLLHQVPLWEKRLSEPLGNISIVYDKTSPSLGVPEYLNHLHRLVMGLRRFRFGRIGYPLKPATFKGIECNILSPNGPMSLSDNGQFRVPASTPAELLVDFLLQNKQKSLNLQEKLNKNIAEEQEVISTCKQTLGLKSLRKDESVSFQQMMTCCQALIQQPLDELFGTRVIVSKYYQVSDDGQITIPWDWQ
ncbi:T-cell activation inhibitor, mitochondrial-like isoform X2 [Actinia tenebrosa]|uniref:T-cell activation inhibitor, mitochondrial-like isoform X2 n=1 Tax=Actinia tenebrosa TaxID=6105 RepID=A0A6P8IYE1_ACTTE|nr:T-cell activation inhibitor, mitochondrial-like isoform X2 [Actinia tenebrosa]